MQKEYDLSFARIIILENDLAEVIINESIEMTMTHLSQLRDTLKNILGSPYYLIINKLNHYSYDFVTQCEVGNSCDVKATAVICYSDTVIQTTRFLAKLKDKEWNMQIFSNKENALNWINQQKHIYAPQ